MVVSKRGDFKWTDIKRKHERFWILQGNCVRKVCSLWYLTWKYVSTTSPIRNMQQNQAGGRGQSDKILVFSLPCMWLEIVRFPLEHSRQKDNRLEARERRDKRASVDRGECRE